jgi:hypothetical protein
MDRLITMAHRARARRSTTTTNRITATLPKGSQFDDQEELQEFWAKQLKDVPEAHYIPAIGADGVFSDTMKVQIEQITKLEHSFCLSHGLGYVPMVGSYPDYDFGQSEGDVTVGLRDPRKFNARRWWEFVTTLRGITLVDILRDAIEGGDRLLLTIPPDFLTYILGDLTKITKSDELKLADVKKTLRIIGNEAEDRVPAALMDCVMPYTDAVDRVVVGTRPTRVRRIAYLLTKVSPNGRDPIQDYKLVQAYIDNPSSPVLNYASAPAKTKSAASTALDDAQLSKLISDSYWDRCHGLGNRIKRALREDGYRVAPEKVDEIVSKIAKKAGKVADKPAGGTGEKKKAAVEAKPATKTVSAKPSKKAAAPNGVAAHS